MKWTETTHQEVWEGEWKDICTNEDGTVNLDQIQRELFDYAFILDQVPKVYEEVAGLSKPNAYANSVIDHFERKRKDTFEMWLKDFIDNCEDTYKLHKESDNGQDNEFAEGIKWVLDELKEDFGIE
ncbi:hypothetical protein IAQ67_15945 [Paenibacillus peoriae]|uniref:Uncharacterized protein n=1 Tax=Paenibacillus peoriae TaxID=59893 RepID=A0A7H0Y2S7_9BACL|nr:hypothetical protein [Paenibacillus peoriae]QNR65385.1 hypothetical protein IAQ67_15945 [Paenibacillus peoriae]